MATLEQYQAALQKAKDNGDTRAIERFQSKIAELEQAPAVEEVETEVVETEVAEAPIEEKTEPTLEQYQGALEQAQAKGDTRAEKRFQSKIDEISQKQRESLITPDPLSDMAGELFGGVTEPLTFMAGNVAGLIGSGAEMVARAPFQGLDKAIEEGKKTQQTVSEFVDPQTQQGQAGVDTITTASEWAAKIPAGWGGLAKLATTGDPQQAAELTKEIEQKGLPKALGDKTLEETNSPMLATMVESVPELAGAFFGSRFIIDKRKQRNTEKARDELDMAVKIMNNEPGADLGRYRLAKRDAWRAPDPAVERAVAQRLKEDPAFAEQIKGGIPKAQKSKSYGKTSGQEWDEGLLNMISSSTGGDIASMERMLNTYDKAMANPEMKVMKRPIQEAGETIQNYVKYLGEERRKRGKKVGEAAEQLRGEKVSFEPALDNFIERLTSQGVVFNKGEPITEVSQYNEIDFRNSPFHGSEASENILRDQIKRMAMIDFEVDGFNMHNLKKSLPHQISTAKKKEGGLVQLAEIYLNDLRRDVNGILGEHSEDYKRANQRFAEVVRPLEKYNDAMPPKDRIEFDGVDPRKAGIQARKVLSNYSNSIDVTDAINDIAMTAQKLGIDYNDDPLRQVIFAINLDKRLGAYADQTFQGIQESAQSRVMGSIPTGTTDASVQLLGGLMRKMRKVDNRRAIDSMREYLQEAKTGKAAKQPKDNSGEDVTDIVEVDADF